MRVVRTSAFCSPCLLLSVGPAWGVGNLCLVSWRIGDELIFKGADRQSRACTARKTRDQLTVNVYSFPGSFGRLCTKQTLRPGKNTTEKEVALPSARCAKKKRVDAITILVATKDAYPRPVSVILFCTDFLRQPTVLL